MELWNGDCCVHERITADMILEKSKTYPEADILIHPESNCSQDDRILNMPQAYMYSTAGMIKHAASSPKQQFVIATEIETIHKLQKDNPTKEFIPVHPTTICGQMKKVTLVNVLEALEKNNFRFKYRKIFGKEPGLPLRKC